MEWWHVYLFTRLDVLNKLLVFCMVFGSIAAAAHIVASFVWDGSRSIEEDNRVRAILRKRNPYVVAVWAMAVVLYATLPTQKEFAAIYLLPKLAHSDFTKEAQQIPTDAAKLIRS